MVQKNFSDGKRKMGLLISLNMVTEVFLNQS
jgi:hypothetical protein